MQRKRDSMCNEMSILLRYHRRGHGIHVQCKTYHAMLPPLYCREAKWISMFV